MSDQYYERYWSEEGFNPRHALLPGRLQQLLDTYVPRESSVLDMGCGSGNKVKKWVQENELDYLGLDVSGQAVRAANANGLKAQKVDGLTSLPVDDNSVDTVICFEVLEHLMDPQLAVTEATRVLKPGGHVVLTVPNTGFIRYRHQLLRGTWNPAGDALSISQPWRDPHIRFFTLSSLENMVNSVGLETVELGGHQDNFSNVKTSYRTVIKNNPLFKALEDRFPSLLSRRVHLIARKN